MSREDDLPIIPDTAPSERRVGDRRRYSTDLETLENTLVTGDRRQKVERRNAHHCIVCGNTFTRANGFQRVCKPCKMSGLRMGQPAGTLF